MTAIQRVSPPTGAARRRVRRLVAFGLGTGVGFVLVNAGLSRALAEGPTVSVSPSHAPAGGSVIASGSGWPAGSVEIHLAPDVSCGDPSTLVAEGPVTDGTIAVSFRVPTDLATGKTYLVSACVDKTYGTTPLLVDPPAPSIVISPTRPRQGTPVRVTGSHWVPSLGAVSLYVAGAGRPSATSSVLEDGTFVATVPTAGRAAGSYELVACQDCGDPKGYPRAGGTFTVVVPAPTQPPSVQVEPAVAAPGRDVAVTGTHWLPHTDPMRLFATKAAAADATAALGSFRVGATGRISGSFAVPAMTAGQHRLYACQRCGSSRPIAARVTLTVVTTPAVNPAVAADPAHGRPGQTTWLSGSGWRPSGGPVSVFVALADSSDPTRSVASVPVAADGTFRAPVQVPDRSAGHYTLVVCQGCQSAGDRVQATLAFTIDRPSRTVLPYAVGGGALLTLVTGGVVSHRLRGRGDPGQPPRPQLHPQPDDTLDVVPLQPVRAAVTLRLVPHPDRTEPDLDVEVLA